MIRLYGIAKGNSSWPRVTAGVRAGIESHKKFAGLYDVSRVDAEYDDDSMDVGYDASLGLCVGPPLAASVMIGRGHHKHRLLMVAANSTWLPAVVMERAAKLLTGFIAPSHWSAEIIRNYVDIPVYVYQHGVDDEFYPRARKPDGEPYAALHLASTHLERKGTKELIHAWAIAKRERYLPRDAVLRLVVDGPRNYFLNPINEASKGELWIADSYDVRTRLDMSTDDMAAFYCRHDMVCQPSRGEGFGMVPLEARACGVPVVATACTGHSEHSIGGQAMIVVPHGEERPIDDGPGALAPTVSVDDLVVALSDAYENRDALLKAARKHSPMLRRAWSWHSVTSVFLREHGSELGVYP